MSVTPQLKDKVEFSLDNRQIFFLFFGLSVVGCFVFAMGVMVGKRGGLGVIAIHDPVGAAVQRGLLEREGVTVSDRGLIELEEFGWLPGERRVARSRRR